VIFVRLNKDHFNGFADPIWVEVTKKNCSVTCKNQECQGKLFWNDGDEVDIELLDVVVSVTIADPPGTLECSSRFSEFYF